MNLRGSNCAGIGAGMAISGMSREHPVVLPSFGTVVERSSRAGCQPGMFCTTTEDCRECACRGGAPAAGQKTS